MRCLLCMPLIMKCSLSALSTVDCNRAWCRRWVDRKGEIPQGKKPYYRLPVMNYYKVTVGVVKELLPCLPY